MPKIQLKGLDDTVFVLNRLTDKSEGVIKRAIYDGAGILADAVRANIDTIKTGGPSDWERRRRETQKAASGPGLPPSRLRKQAERLRAAWALMATTSWGKPTG